MPSCLTDERTPGVLPPATRGFSQPPVDPVVTHGYSKRHPKRFPGLLRRKAERGSWGTPVACFAPPDLTCLSRFPRLNYQRHFHRSEHWYVMSGEAVVTKNGEDIRLKAGQAVDLPAETWHRVCNPGPAHMVFIEVQTCDYFGEDDLLVDVLGQKRHVFPNDRLDETLLIRVRMGVARSPAGYRNPCSLCFAAMVAARSSKARKSSSPGSPLQSTGSRTSTLRLGIMPARVSTVFPPQP